jgi:hypothetical protein
VVIEVRAVAVVVGATDVIGPPAMEERKGASRGRSRNWSHPRPSSTSNTIWAASITAGGSQGQGGSSARRNSPRTMLSMQPPP